MLSVVLVSRDTAWALALARQPRDSGTPLHVVLLDASAATARATHPCAASIREALAAGVTLSVHDEAALRRGMTSTDVVEGVKTVDLDEIADAVADSPGTVMWL